LELEQYLLKLVNGPDVEPDTPRELMEHLDVKQMQMLLYLQVQSTEPTVFLKTESFHGTKSLEQLNINFIFEITETLAY
jgi:hypothetical protein